MKKKIFLVAVLFLLLVALINVKTFAEDSGEINVITSSIEITTPPTKIEYLVGEKFDPTGMVVTATLSDGTTKEIKNYNYYDGELESGQKTVLVWYEEDDREIETAQEITVIAKKNNEEQKDKEDKNEAKNTTDNTTAKGTIPYTGGTFAIVISAIAITALGIYVYKRNNDLKGI